MIFQNRAHAGKLLAEKLSGYRNHQNALVLALPRGGVPVGFEVSQALNLPLGVPPVRKLGFPNHEEVAMGAVAPGGVWVLDCEMIRILGIPESVVEAAIAAKQEELDRRADLYQRGSSMPCIESKIVILVDDGLATGLSMQAAVAALRRQNPAWIIVAVPVAAPESCEELKMIVDEIICVMAPEPFRAVGAWYENFFPTTDEEVLKLLERANSQKMRKQEVCCA